MGVATVEVDDGLAAKAVRKLDGAQVDWRNVRAWQQPNLHNVDDHFLQLLHWIDLEAKAEQEQFADAQAQSEKVPTSRLVIKEETVGLGGIILVRFAPRNEQATLPWTALSAGSPVTIHEEGQNGAPRWRGVVTQMKRHSIEIGLNFSPEPTADRPTFAINLAHDEISRQRMQRALSQVMAAAGNRLAELRDILRGHQPPAFDAPIPY